MTNTIYMLYLTGAFNQALNARRRRSVTNMQYMLYLAGAFHQVLKAGDAAA